MSNPTNPGEPGPNQAPRQEPWRDGAGSGNQGYGPQAGAGPHGGPYGAQPYGQAPRTNTPAIVALITGIIALVLSWIPGINLIAFVLAIVALITGIIGIRNAARAGTGGKGMAIGGLVTAALALLVGVLVYVGLANLFNDPAFRQELQRQQEQRQDS